MDFMCDSIAGGRRFRTLSIIDEYTRECLTLEVDLSIGGLDGEWNSGALDEPSRDAREMIERWKLEYNEIRPHSALDDMTPIELSSDMTRMKKRQNF